MGNIQSVPIRAELSQNVETQQVWIDSGIGNPTQADSELPYHSMSIIESGKCYKIVNEENGLVFDLSGGDNLTILGWEFSGSDNQQVRNLPYSDTSRWLAYTLQWILEKQGDGQWTIRSVRLNKYLGFKDSPKDGTTLVGFQRPPFLWDIEILPDSEDHDNTRVRYVLLSTSSDDDHSRPDF
jgi:hypothetical protein